MGSTFSSRYSTKNLYPSIAKMSPLRICAIDPSVVRDATDHLRSTCGNSIWEPWLTIRRYSILLSALRLLSQTLTLPEFPAPTKMKFQLSNKPSLEESPATRSTTRPPIEPSHVITAGSNLRHSWPPIFSTTINTPVTTLWSGRSMC